MWHCALFWTSRGRPERQRDCLYRGRPGKPGDSDREISYERSLMAAEAMQDSVLLAYEMNGESLAPDHGGPLRLIVPGWYGMASVKWLASITAILGKFDGYYQVDDYMVRIGDRATPCREMEVRAVILGPAEGNELVTGQAALIRGYAWTGRGVVVDVEISSDGGGSWFPASSTPRFPHTWQSWSAEWTPKGVGNSPSIGAVVAQHRRERAAAQTGLEFWRLLQQRRGSGRR